MIPTRLIHDLRNLSWVSSNSELSLNKANAADAKRRVAD
jgi:hypothetical protein